MGDGRKDNKKGRKKVECQDGVKVTAAKRVPEKRTKA